MDSPILVTRNVSVWAYCRTSIVTPLLNKRDDISGKELDYTTSVVRCSPNAYQIRAYLCKVLIVINVTAGTLPLFVKYHPVGIVVYSRCFPCIILIHGFHGTFLIWSFPQVVIWRSSITKNLPHCCRNQFRKDSKQCTSWLECVRSEWVS